MLISEAKLKLIRQAIDKKYNTLLIQLLGKKDLPKEVLSELRKQGLEPKQITSFLSRIYHHANLNEHASGPKTSGEMEFQQEQRTKPLSLDAKMSLETLNQNLFHLLEKQKADMISRIERLIRNENYKAKFQQQAGKNSTDYRDKGLSQLKQALRDATQDGNRNWDRVVHTEVSNAVGLGSADKILRDHEEERTPDEIYVYRIVAGGPAMCKWCRKFYLDSDGTPKLYKLSTLLSNGSNYGKKASEWLPGVTATHPSERCSVIVELKPGWRVLSGGGQEFMGYKGWQRYVAKKLEV